MNEIKKTNAHLFALDDLHDLVMISLNNLRKEVEEQLAKERERKMSIDENDDGDEKNRKR